MHAAAHDAEPSAGLRTGEKHRHGNLPSARPPARTAAIALEVQPGDGECAKESVEEVSPGSGICCRLADPLGTRQDQRARQRNSCRLLACDHVANGMNENDHGRTIRHVPVCVKPRRGEECGAQTGTWQTARRIRGARMWLERLLPLSRRECRSGVRARHAVGPAKVGDPWRSGRSRAARPRHSPGMKAGAWNESKCSGCAASV